MRRHRVGIGAGKIKSAAYSEFCSIKWLFYSKIKLCTHAKRNILCCSNNFMHYQHTITSMIVSAYVHYHYRLYFSNDIAYICMLRSYIDVKTSYCIYMLVWDMLGDPNVSVAGKARVTPSRGENTLMDINRIEYATCCKRNCCKNSILSIIKIIRQAFVDGTS
jgi:hypothetical protein